MSLWPSMSWMERKSAPRSSRWVANECRIKWGVSGVAKPARGAVSAQNLPETHAGQTAPTPVQEKPGGVEFPHQRRAAPAKIGLHGAHRGLTHRGQALLVSLPQAANQTQAEIEIAGAHVNKFGNAHPGSVEHLEQGLVAQTEGRGDVGLGQKLVN